ncbi:MAG: metallophosphoesterase family protein [Chloroflexi bacterium]|nr:metallophosphoesterase family protein [Chloroflexota bacterium]
MRVLLLADVHANWEALLALQRAERRPDALLFAGDAVGYGPDPVPCARWLLANATGAVQGNHDHAVSRPEGSLGICQAFPPDLAEAAVATLTHTRTLLSPPDLARLGGWPLSAVVPLGGTRFYLAHGTPAAPLTGDLNPATCPEAGLHALFDHTPGDVIVLGHSHLPAIRRFGRRLIVNPGSLGQPRYGLPDATYAVWEDGHLQIKHLHYNHDLTAARLRMLPLSAEVLAQLAGILESGLVPAVGAGEGL